MQAELIPKIYREKKSLFPFFSSKRPLSLSTFVLMPLSLSLFAVRIFDSSFPLTSFPDTENVLSLLNNKRSAHELEVLAVIREYSLRKFSFFSVMIQSLLLLILLSLCLRGQGSVPEFVRLPQRDCKQSTAFLLKRREDDFSKRRGLTKVLLFSLLSQRHLLNRMAKKIGQTRLLSFRLA